jgi:SP family sugar:H+ symporter-like MFS transporter
MSSVKSLGTVNPFDFNLIIASVNIVSICVTLSVIDRIGRR